MIVESKGNTTKFLLVICLFVFTLENHGNIRFVLLTPVFLYFFLYVFLVKLNYDSVKAASKIFFVLILVSILSYFSLTSYKENMGTYNTGDFFYTTTLKVFVVFLFFNVLNKNRNLLINVIETVLLIHLLMFFLQFITVYTSGYYPDLLEPFTGEASRFNWGLSVPIIGQTYRPTGFFNEPSTYLSIVFSLLCLKFYISRELSLINKAVLASLFLSLSFASVAAATAFLIIINLKGHSIYKYLPITLVVIALASPLVIDLYTARSSGNYDAIGIRFQLIYVVFTQNIFDLLMGNGPVGVPSALAYLYKSDSISWTKEGFAAINDNGLGLFIIIKFGLLGLLSFMLYVKYKSSSFICFMCIALLLITKIKLTSLLFIFVVFSIVLLARGSEREV